MTDKTLVFGRGYFGTRIAEDLQCPVVGREADPLDAAKLHACLDREKPDVVINAIGKTGGIAEAGIGWCETHKLETFDSNVEAATALSFACLERGIYFVHLGSGCIYQGGYAGQGFTEEDQPNFYGPQFYAKTKILAELVLRNLPGLILRIRMPIDNRHHPKNLIDKLARYSRIIQQPNSMTTVPHAIPIIRALIERRSQGIYNLVNPGLISPEEIMSAYRRLVDGSHTFGVMSLHEFDETTSAKRANCHLSTAKLAAEGLELPEIHQAVEECLGEYKKRL